MSVAPLRLIVCLATAALTLCAHSEEVRSCEELLKEAQAALDVATDAFNRLGNEGSESHDTRLEAETNVQLAMGNSDIALEFHEDECGQEAEDLLTKASSLYFWIRRTAPMSFYEWKDKEKGGDGDDLFSSDDYAEITKKNREKHEAEIAGTDEPEGPEDPEQPNPTPKVSRADMACARFEEAKKVESKDPFEAVMAYSEVASDFPEQDCGKQAMARVAEIMNPASDAQKPTLSAVVANLKQGLGSDDLGERILAARDARNMKAKAVVLPLIKALGKEDSGSKVTPYILAALRTTHRRETCYQLGDVSKAGPKRWKDKDEDLQLAVIDCLADIGGQLGGQAIGSFLGSKNQKVIDHAFAKCDSLGIDGGLGLAVGFGSLLKNRNQVNVNKCLDLMGKLQHGACVSAILMGGKGLLSKRQKDNPYFDKLVGREDIYEPPQFWNGGILAKIGWNGVWALIDEGMDGGEARTRTYSHFILKKITGWSIALNTQEWKDRFRQEVTSGARPLPYGMTKLP